MADSQNWPGAIVAKLRDLWHEGHPTAEIGRRLGVSKNTVIGKAHRLDLPGRPSPLKTPPGDAAPSEQRRRVAPAPTLPLVAEAPAVARVRQRPSQAVVHTSIPSVPVSASLPVTTDGFVRQCCWPIGEPGAPSFRYCDQPINGRGPYCMGHAHIVYVRRPLQPIDMSIQPGE